MKNRATAYDAPAAQVYQVPSGPDTDFTFVQQVGNQPIIGSDALAPQLSPFTFRILPPLIYLDNPGILAGTEKGTKKNPIQLGYTTNAAIGNFSDFKQTLNAAKQARDTAFSGLLDSKPDTPTPSYVKGKSQARPTGSSNRSSIEQSSRVNPAITDMEVAQDIAIQLRRILNMPPLILYINPTQMSISYNKVQEYSQRSRSQIIYQTWGEEQPKLSVSAKIGAFIAGAVQPSGSQQTTSAPQGVQHASKRDSAAFQQFMSVLSFYKNNGYIYDTIGRTNAHHLVGVVEISYDHFVYIGNFQSFNWRYDEQHQNGGMEFDFEFTVSQMYDLHEGVGPVRILQSPTPNPSDMRFANQDSPMQPLPGRSVAGLTFQSNQAPNLPANPVAAPSLPGKAFKKPVPATPAPTNTVPMQAFFNPKKV